MGKDKNSIPAYRNRKKLRNFLLNLISFCVVIAAAVIAWRNIERIAAPFEGVAARLGINVPTGEGGFPVKLPGSAGYSFYAQGDNFVLLTDTYLYSYAADGRQNYTEQHGYANPYAYANGKRVLVYDKNGHKFSLYDKSGRVFETEKEEKIICSALGEDEASAVVLPGGVMYASVLEVYGGKGEWKYRRRFLGEHVIKIAFCGGDKELVVAAIGFSGGDNTCSVTKFKLDSEDENGMWRCELPANALPYGIYADETNVYVICDGALYAIDSENGNSTGSYRFSGSIEDFAFSADNTILLINDYSAGVKRLVSTDASARLTGEITVPESAPQVEIYGDAIITLESGGIAVYGKADLERREYIPFEDEYSRFIYINGNYYLLGYDTVELIETGGNETTGGGK